MTTVRVKQASWVHGLFAPERVNGLPVRYRVALGGRGSGKSTAFAQRLLIRAATESILILCTRELQKSIKDSVHRLLVNQIEAMGLESLFEYDKTHIRSKSGSEFIFMGMRFNSSEIKSTEGIDVCWIEEGQATKPDSLQELIPTIRAEGSEIYVTYNPKFEDDPIHKMFVTEGRPNAIVKHVNWDLNPWFPSTLRTEMEHMRAANPKLASRVWDGEIVVIGSGDFFPTEKAAVIDEVSAGIGRIVRAWDLAATEPSDTNPDPDYTAGVKMALDDIGPVILDVQSGQINANKVRNLVRATAEKDGPDVSIAVPQDPGQAGKEQADSYKRMLSGYTVKADRVTGDKETRAEGLSAAWQAGTVRLVRGSWNDDFLRLMNAFPAKGEHDDVVDAAADAYSSLVNGPAYDLSALL